MKRNFDTIIIGSGLSGMTTAGICSKLLRKKVLLVEQHFKPGGLTHTFKRKGFEWDVGLHYVGEMYEGAFPRKILDYITDKKLKWKKMPDPFEIFHFNDKTYTFYSDPEKNKLYLKQQFPREESLIDQFYADLNKCLLWGNLFFATKVLPNFLSIIPRFFLLFVKDYSQITLDEYLIKLNTSRELSAVLSAQIGDHGLPPNKVSYFAHALIFNHYKRGGYYPEEGSSDIANKIISSFPENLVEIKVSTEVIEVKKKNGLFHVLVKNKKTLETQWITSKSLVSSIGARQVYQRFLNNKKLEKQLNSFEPSLNIVTAFIGFKDSPKNLGFQGENHWFFTTYDLNKIDSFEEKLQDSHIKSCYLSFSSLKMKESVNQKHSATALIPVPINSFKKWSQTKWRKRPEDYEELKSVLANKIVTLIDNDYPGFKNKIAHIEVSTPLSSEHFIQSHQGEAYGIPSTPERFKLFSLKPRSNVKGFILGGTDIFFHGISGALASGLIAATCLIGPQNVIKLFKKIIRNE